MSFQYGDIVCFNYQKNAGKRIVYIVVDELEVMLYSNEFRHVMPHTKLEVIGWIPTEVLTLAPHSPDNISAIDYALNNIARLN